MWSHFELSQSGIIKLPHELVGAMRGAISSCPNRALSSFPMSWWVLCVERSRATLYFSAGMGLVQGSHRALGNPPKGNLHAGNPVDCKLTFAG